MDRLSKKQAELYIGCTQLDWEYIVVPYMADCTEALPLTIMDKVICGLLSVDGRLTALKLGEILGLNVNDDPENGEYRDEAEACILDKAIGSLLDYGMIKCVSNTDLFTLTDIGREYYANGYKFRTTKSRSFDVYFDRVTDNHGKAKRIFAGTSGDCMTIQTPKCFYDELFLKSFIHEQNPSIYDKEKGSSFTNISCPDSVDVVKTSVCVAVLYDVLTKRFRFQAFIGDRLCTELSEIIASYDMLYDKLVDKIGGMLEDSVKHEDCLTQEKFELTLMENPYSVIEPEEFWEKLNVLVGNEEKDIFMNVDVWDEEKCMAITSFCKDRPSVNVFLSCGTYDIEMPFVQNLFCIDKVLSDDYILCGANVTYAMMGYVINCRDKRLHANMVFRYGHTEVDLSLKKRFFAEELLPGMIDNVLEYLNGDIDVAKGTIEEIVRCDCRLNVFRDFIDEETLLLIVRKKEDAIARVEQGLVEEIEKGESEKPYKTYIVDTNVFLDDPEILYKFKAEDRVVLSGQVLQELDKKKRMEADGVVSANARKAVRAINDVRKKDKYSKRKFLLLDYADMSLLPEELQTKKGDHFILGVAMKYIDSNPRMLTSDNILGLTAESIGIPVITLDEFYKENGM